MLTVSPRTMPSLSEPTSTAADAGQYPGAEDQFGHADLLTEQRHRLGQRQRGADGSLGIVLARDRAAPDGHHGVTDELLHGPAVAFDQRPAAIEVLAEQVTDLFGIAMLAERCESDEIGEQNRYQSPLREARRRGAGRGRSAVGVQPNAAFAAEAIARLVLGSAARAANRERRPAMCAEPAPGSVLRSARRAGRHRAEILVGRGPDGQTGDRCVSPEKLG